MDFHNRGHHPHNRMHGQEGGGHPSGRGGRMRRGESRWLLLDTLTDKPMHGYEIIKTLGERSGGRYAPSPGTVYPVLQFLEEAGFVQAEAGGDRRVYGLTESGRTELARHSDEIAHFWQEINETALSGVEETEMTFLRDEAQLLHRTVWGGIEAARGGKKAETIRRIRKAVEGCRNEVRQILTEQSEQAEITSV